jgi:hypothetical protein
MGQTRQGRKRLDVIIGSLGLVATGQVSVHEKLGGRLAVVGESLGRDGIKSRLGFPNPEKIPLDQARIGGVSHQTVIEFDQVGRVVFLSEA